MDTRKIGETVSSLSELNRLVTNNQPNLLKSIQNSKERAGRNYEKDSEERRPREATEKNNNYGTKKIWRKKQERGLKRLLERSKQWQKWKFRRKDEKKKNLLKQK